MSLCGQSPLFVPTTVNAVLRNIDAVDCAATNISCTNLTVNGEPIGTSIQNMAGSTPGITVFTGDIKASNIELASPGTVTSYRVETQVINSTTVNSTEMEAATITANTELIVPGTATINNLNITGTVGLTDLTLSGDIQSSTGMIGTFYANDITTQTVDVTDAATFATNITQAAGTAALKAVTCTSITNSGNATVKQVLQTTPAFLMHSFANQSITTSAEVTAKFLATPYITQGTTNLSYSVSTGLFTNNSGSSKVYNVSYTMYWAGATGGRRASYIRLSNTVGNYPPGATSPNQDSEVNTAYSYQIGGDTTAIKQTGSANIMLANGGSFGVYVYQSQGASLNVSGHVLITSV
jgi:hypothetical protein